MSPSSEDLWVSPHTLYRQVTGYSVRKNISLIPAQLCVEIFEAGGQNGPDSCAVKEHDWYSHQSVEDAQNLTQSCFGNHIAIAWIQSVYFNREKENFQMKGGEGLLTDGGKDCETEHEAGAEGPGLVAGLPPSVSLPHPLHGPGLEVLDDGRHQGPGEAGLQHVVGHCGVKFTFWLLFSFICAFSGVMGEQRWVLYTQFEKEAEILKYKESLGL